MNIKSKCSELKNSRVYNFDINKELLKHNVFKITCSYTDILSCIENSS